MRRLSFRLGVPLGVTFVLGVLASAGRAAVSFDFVTDEFGTTGTTFNYGLTPLASRTVNLYLRETLTAGSASTLSAENGLYSSVIRVDRTVSPSSPATITGAAKNSTNFNDQTDAAVLSAGAQANVGGTRSLGEANGTPIITDSATVRRVLIGTLTFQAGNTLGQTTTFRLADRSGAVGSPDNTSDTLTWTNGTILDSLIAARTFTVTTPEPSAAGLLFVAAVGLLRRRRRAAAA